MDAGNTRLKWAVFPARVPNPESLPAPVRSGAQRCGEPFDPAVWAEGRHIASAALAGSNLEERTRIEQQWPENSAPLTVYSDRDRFPIEIDVEFPERVGTDRLLNAIAANRLREPDQRAIVVDSGTATTVDLISAEGTFRGGAILPGLLLSARALHEYTSVLPLVPMPLSGESLPEVIGKNTEAAIISGICWGHVGAVNGLIAAMSVEADSRVQPPLILLTGGAGPWLANSIQPAARHCPHLALQGLWAVATLRSGEESGY
jgi:type III pantothenate kinase